MPNTKPAVARKARPKTLKKRAYDTTNRPRKYDARLGVRMPRETLRHLCFVAEGGRVGAATLARTLLQEFLLHLANQRKNQNDQ